MGLAFKPTSSMNLTESDCYRTFRNSSVAFKEESFCRSLLVIENGYVLECFSDKNIPSFLFLRDAERFEGTITRAISPER